MPTFQHSKRPLLTTSHRCCLSDSACSILMVGANLTIATRCSARRVTRLACGQEMGRAGRKTDGATECDVRMAAHAKSVINFWSCVVSWVEAAARGLARWDTLDAEFRIDHTKASMSSKMIEWTHRCRLLCRVWSKRYAGSERSVTSRDAHDCGRNMCRWHRLDVSTCFSLPFVV